MSEPHLGPNDIPQLYECLKAALSQDHNRQKQAEATLEGLETRHGYTSCLAVAITTVGYALACTMTLQESGRKGAWHAHAGGHWQ